MHAQAIGPSTVTDVSKAELLRNVLSRLRLENIRTEFSGLNDADTRSKRIPRPRAPRSRTSALSASSQGDWHGMGTVPWGRLMHLTPRKLTTHQKAVLIQVLLTFPDQQVGVRYDPSASDALSYAEDFLTVFKVIGWKVTEGAPREIANGPCTGLAFVVCPNGGLPPSAEALRDALRIYGIEIATICDPTCNRKSASIILAVGRERPSVSEP
jgi:hypothetical protein